MGIIKRMRREKAVYWPPTVAGSDGRPGFGTAVEMDVRWTDTAVNFMDDEGNSKTSKAVVFCDRVCLLRGYLWRGAIAGAPADPRVDRACIEIRGFKQVKNLRYTETLYKAFL